MKLLAESIFGNYEIQIDQQRSYASIVDLHNGSKLQVDLSQFEGVNPSSEIESMFGIGCRVIHSKVKEALAEPELAKIVDESLVQGALELMINDYRNKYGSQISQLSNRIYQSSAVDFWELVPGLIERNGYIVDNHVIAVAKELEARGLVKFNKSKKGFMLTNSALNSSLDKPTFIKKANHFFREQQLLMALFTIAGLILTIVSFI